MRNIKNFLSICFNKISSQDIVGENSCIEYNFSKSSKTYSIFLNLMDEYEPQYSRNELRGQLAYFEDVCEERSQHWGFGKTFTNCIDLYELMFYYVSRVLTFQNDNVCCKYKDLLSWRMLTLELSEDMLVCAYLADYDVLNQIDRKVFDWPVVIGHNNTELNMILNEGMAENHFHLKGSAPMFHITWCRFMNGKINNNDKENLKSIERKSRKAVSEFYWCKNLSLEKMIMQATFIRVYLFSRLTGMDLVIKLDKENLLSLVIKCLSSDDSLILYSDEFYGCINELKMLLLDKDSSVLSDYAVLERDDGGYYSSCEASGAYPTNSALYRGERHFMYLAFLDIRENHILTELEKNLFYAYLVIKERLRHEMLQVNYNQVGFENFSIIEDRKSYFISGDDLILEAMKEAMFYPGMKYLEARIVPYDTADDNRKLIQKLDRSIDPGKKYRNRYGYIMHFVKSSDEDIRDVDKIIGSDMCRHHRLRREIMNKAEALMELREKYPEQGKRILAIDACNQEIGCRPEVFSCAFRRLKAHSVDRKNQSGMIPQLKLTYHVGEDYLDPLDGMRAIDEAINFLNMDCGDRLGHALALGINVKEWYKMKGRITLPQQDYLDNIVWLYCALLEFSIEGFDNLKSHLEQEYEILFNIIYRPYINPTILKNITDAATQYYSKFSCASYFFSDSLKFDIYNYQKSYMLRGDDPRFYKEGYFKNDIYFDYRLHPYEVNYDDPKKFNYRLLPEAAILYHYYHFNNNVKRAGSRYIYKHLHPDYINAVDVVQKCMQKKIAQLGICIETNPTSNYLISTFKRYDKHPILRWYNQSLEKNPKKIAESPQISVSINTDDMGVFATKLSNEFSIMALALEKMKDEKNNRIYDKTSIYKWIDDIRKFGLQQNFVYQNKLLYPDNEGELES